MSNINVWMPIVTAVLGFVIGSVIGHATGRVDGEADAREVYERKRRAYAKANRYTNGGAE